ncbi:hypothetical protein BDW62DRAFT_192066 [Aspergillus aurantiobrunneus]
METAKFLPPQTQSCESQIHFTPVKNSHVPRVWDRKPSTSFLARSKPRKVWKRFRSSFNSMKALQQLIAPDVLQESELLLEINTRRNAENSRGVKRQCLAAAHKSAGGDDNVEPSNMRGRSFLEKKWESEVSRKPRTYPTGEFVFRLCYRGWRRDPLTTVSGKLPAATSSMDEHMIFDDGLRGGEDDEMATATGDRPGETTSTGDSTVQGPEKTGESPTLTPDRSDIGAAYPDALPGEPGRLPNEERGVIVDINSLNSIEQEEFRALKPTNAADGAAATDHVSDAVTVATNVDNQDTMAVPVELTAEQESTLVRSALRSSLDGDDTALLNNFLSKAKAKREAKAAAEAEATATVIATDPEEQEQETEQPPPQQQVFVEVPTPERRVLEDLDANSSPQKSPSKSAEKDKNENGSASPVARRSTRVRSLQRAAAPSSFRPMLSLRRAKGNEFVFLQRTEAQELALTTRRNTKQNKGDALLPKFTLQGLPKETPNSSPASDDNHNKSNKPKKCVSWNEERLVEFEGEDSDDELAGQPTKPTKPNPTAKKRAASSRTSQSQASLKTGGEKAAAAATTASPSAAPRGRRVRRLGPSKPLDSTTLDSNDAASSSLSPTMASPIAKRKKLTPKTRTPSKVPTPTGTHNEIPSLLSGGRSVKTNLLKVNAGSTPMPRRVRRA